MGSQIRVAIVEVDASYMVHRPGNLPHKIQNSGEKVDNYPQLTICFVSGGLKVCTSLDSRLVSSCRYFSSLILYRLVLCYCKTAPYRSRTQPVLGLVNVWAIAKQVLTVPGWCIYTLLDYPKTKQLICHDITLGLNFSRF